MHTRPHLSPQLLPGRTAPMGALARDGGVNFAVFSEHAQRVELCVFDTSGARELRRYDLDGPHGGVFCGFLPGVGPGLVYGLRAHGPHDPEAGHRFNPHKLLLDPWAREIVGRFAWHAEHHGYTLGHPDGTRSLDPRDNAALALKARVAAPPAPAPGLANAPRRPLEELVLYEVHVKGFSQLNPAIPPALRGTYSALAHPAAVAHFKALGVNTLSLLPVHHRLDEAGLAERGLTNYWGYNTIGFFAPDPRFARQRDDPTAVAQEFRAMVHALHEAGIGVVLDVVFNHTPEGSEAGPTISMRGLDHRSWYRLAPDDRSHCENFSGCGNTLNVSHPRVTQFVLDSLRYWVHEMGVDGFRFDLAPVLGRDRGGSFRTDAAFFTALHQDPVLAPALLIAESWDGGPEGYQVGRFPSPWLEWNDRFRDAARLYWLKPGQGVGRGEFARRLSGSSDLFQHAGRAPTSGVNFITAHDGFTLADLTRFSAKRNAANGEDNRDGRDGEFASGLGAEGDTDDPAVLEARRRVRRALLATLALAQGTPMLLAGDELGNGQDGNNNAWCQDNAVGWLDWPGADMALAAYVGRLFALRREAPSLHNGHWFGRRGAAVATRRWLHPAGHDMQIHDWDDVGQTALAWMVVSAGVTGAEPAEAWLLAFNPEPQPQRFVLPPGPWRLRLDSCDSLSEGPLPEATAVLAPARSVLVLHRPASDTAAA